MLRLWMTLVSFANAAGWYESAVLVSGSTSRGPCGDSAHSARYRVDLPNDALLTLEVAVPEGRDLTLSIWPENSETTCHASFSIPIEDNEVAALAARWLPAGTHWVTLGSAEPSSAVLSMGAVGIADLVAEGMSPLVAEAALHAADTAWTNGEARRATLAIVDFSRPSTEERLWVVDLLHAETVAAAFVSHGIGSGHSTDPKRASRFSNTPHSNQSSLGLYVGAETYIGTNGRSLRLDGLDPGLNDLARERAIVFHGAQYARVDHIADEGYLGRSHGCPAVDDRIAQDMIDWLYGGGLLYLWYPSPSLREWGEHQW